jgi:methylmalonyl-CoA/ethylmalonyl-CoA epimerase
MAHFALNRPDEQPRGAEAAKDDYPNFLVHGNCLLHHLGFVVPSIATMAPGFAALLSARWDGAIIHDRIQQVRVAFFYPVDSRNPVFELVEPAEETSPVTSFLKQRGGLHHICYEIDDLESGLEHARRGGWAVASAPAPAAAFGGRRIAWIFSRHRLLTELLERSHS